MVAELIIDLELMKACLRAAGYCLRVVRETDEGIVVTGARVLATLGPISDEIMVFPSTILSTIPDAERYAFAFSIPSATAGLKFVCRESFDLGRPSFDHPLGSRFEEMDAIVLFGEKGRH